MRRTPSGKPHVVVTSKSGKVHEFRADAKNQYSYRDPVTRKTKRLKLSDDAALTFFARQVDKNDA